jgi:hypothetical protein
MIRRAITRCALLAVMAFAVAFMLVVPSNANWLTHILKEAGEAGTHGAGKVGRHLDGLDNVARHLKSLPEAPGTVAVAAHIGPGGHWHFTNKAGDTFTAANADELARMPAAMAPDAGGSKLAFHLTPETVAAAPAALKDLPDGSALFVVSAKKSYPLIRQSKDGADRMLADAGSGLLVEVADKKLFEDALFQLAQPIKRSSVRVLSLSPGGADTLNRVPGFDSKTKTALVDAIDPQSLARALPSVSGQTVVLTGRVSDGVLLAKPSSGAEISLKLSELRQAAEAADVNLVIVRASDARQPGGRNWFWQTIAVPGLDDAVKQQTFGDFLGAVGSSSGAPMTITASQDRVGRVVLSAVPQSQASSAVTGQIESWMDSIASTVTGQVLVEGIDVDARDQQRQEELDLRFIPGIPSSIQISYLISWIMGLISIAKLLPWWRRIWPAEARDEYSSALGYRSAQAMRGLLFTTIFMPLAGPFGLLAYVVEQIWAILTAPFRFIMWVINRLRPGARA